MRALYSALLMLAACASTPDLESYERVESFALAPAYTSALGELFEGAARPLSSFAPVDGGDEAFDARLALIAAADSSLDVQSYLWHEDSSGALLMERLLVAADRGVRVRLLIDGFKADGEAIDRGLDAHPNLELRVFNPTLHRGGLWRKLEIIEHIERYDHRMHNKLLIADGSVALTGGRNVGNEYLGLGSSFDFRDFELLAAGPVVGHLEEAFDEFWNSKFSLPVREPQEATEEAAKELAAARRILTQLHNSDRRLERRRALPRQAWLDALGHARSLMTDGHARVLHDTADIFKKGATGLMALGFEKALQTNHGDVLVVTAYLVPDQAIIDNVRKHTAAGHRVRILTNSMLTTNQPLAHSFYQESRRDLLAAGAELYELRPNAFAHTRYRSPGSRGRFLGLHAKSAVIGSDHVLVGSMNVDPRSMVLNTEMGVLVESRLLADQVRRRLEIDLSPRNSWRVREGAGGGLEWVAGDVVHSTEPSPGAWSRFHSWLLGWLPLRGEV